MSEIVRCADAEELAQRAAARAARELEARVARNGSATLALSGGTTPGRTHELLAREPVMREPLEIWFVDERCVGPDDAESNYLLARQTLLDPASVPAERVHRMAGELGPDEGARRYGEELTAALGERPALDVVLLGIGPDGHTASLFPDSPLLAAQGPCLGVHDSPKPPPERITLSLPVLRRAAWSVLLVTGSAKASAVARMFGPPSEETPASLLERDRLTVFAEGEALADL